MKKLSLMLIAGVLVLASGCNLFSSEEASEVEGTGDVVDTTTGTVADEPTAEVEEMETEEEEASEEKTSEDKISEDDKLVEELMKEITNSLETEIDSEASN